MVEPISDPPNLAREFYQRPTEVVAGELLGKLLVRKHRDGMVVLRINEVEAYLGINDPACHTFGGRRTARTEVMWGEAGHTYVYLIYGIHNCLNVVTMGPGQPEAVLIRCGEVISGRGIVRTRRGLNVEERFLADGPGKLCQALAVTRAEDGLDLCSESTTLEIKDDGFLVEEGAIRRLPRIGVDYSGEAASWPLRLRTSSRV